ncbi:hypothetical protein DKX38_029926 [Salix brachista]|uniref:Uncharacterized protein n=1 Tax=Salix brachista TaxID=2182728 RepID=A0A5N5J0E0_9ROSI|nr:hypothetical protein DKX38_029926 [Salix brachista]
MANVTDALSGGRMEEHKLAALNQLKNIFGLGKREAESITLDITSKVYRKRLAQGVSSGDLEFSDSKAAFLQNLCEELHFDPQKATEIHEGTDAPLFPEIYRQKLQQCAADGVLSDEDVKALTRLRVMLCIPQHTIDAAHSDICGSLFEKLYNTASPGKLPEFRLVLKSPRRRMIQSNQLGGILGLTVREIVEVHRSLAEQAFRQQAEVILADGQLTKARIEQLNELQKQVGLPPEYAQKVIKNITITKMAAALETAINRGRLNMKQIRELKEASIDFNSMISEKLRENLHKKTVDEIFSSGTGEFDEEEVYEKIPIDLNINAEKAKGVVHELARSRLSNSLIQAVALLRQRNQQGVVSTLNDLLACDKAVPSEPLTWEVPEELADLYTIYMKNNPAPEKLCRLQYLLGISDSAATALGETILSWGRGREVCVLT